MGISKEPNLTGFRGTIEKIVVVRIDPWGRTILSAYQHGQHKAYNSTEAAALEF